MLNNARDEINKAKLSEVIVTSNENCLAEYARIKNSYDSQNQAIINDAKENAINKLKLSIKTRIDLKNIILGDCKNCKIISLSPC